MSHGAEKFLRSLAHSLAAYALYPEGHKSRHEALDDVFLQLQDVLQSDERPLFSFLGEDVVYGQTPLREMRGWEWGPRLAELGIERLEFKQSVTRSEVDAFLEELHRRMFSRRGGTAEARPMAPSAIRWGHVGLKGEEDMHLEDVKTGEIEFSLREETETVRWMHDEIARHRPLPLLEANAVVRGLALAMHGEQQFMLPLVRMRSFDEYTTAHSLNVATLSMALAEWVGLGAEDVRSFGIAGLLHDLDKLHVPHDILVKPGKLEPKEREAMNLHPAEGARMIIAAEPDLALAAVVSYEHHIMIDGGGYPVLKYPRDCHYASKLVHVCDVYDALRTHRPYREAWPTQKALSYLEDRAGREFDPQLAAAFVKMIRTWEAQTIEVTEDQTIRCA